MSFLHKLNRVFFVVGIMAVYFAVLWMGLTEENRRSLTIVKSSATSDDFVTIDVRVTSVNTSQGLVYARIRLVPMGRFALDKTTPGVDLRLWSIQYPASKSRSFLKESESFRSRSLVFSPEIQTDIHSTTIRATSILSSLLQRKSEFSQYLSKNQITLPIRSRQLWLLEQTTSTAAKRYRSTKISPQ